MCIILMYVFASWKQWTIGAWIYGLDPDEAIPVGTVSSVYNMLPVKWFSVEFCMLKLILRVFIRCLKNGVSLVVTVGR